VGDELEGGGSLERRWDYSTESSTQPSAGSSLSDVKTLDSSPAARLAGDVKTLDSSPAARPARASRELPGAGSAARPIQRSSDSGPSDRKVRIRDEATGDIAEYTVDKFEDKILDTVFGLGKASAGNDRFLEAEEVLSELDTNVHIVGLRDPSGAVLSYFDVPDASFWSSVIQDAPIDTIDGLLQSIERGLAIAGMIAGCATGHAYLAYACFKELVRSEVHDLSVSAVEHLISGAHSGSSPTGNHATANPHPATRYFEENRLAIETDAREDRRRRQAAEERLRETRLRPRSELTHRSHRYP
jgi:hypothetical protein